MFDVLTEWMSPLLLAQRDGGIDIQPTGTRHVTITPYGPFVAADGVTLNVAMQNDRPWELLCGVLGLDQFAANARLAVNSGRLAHREEVEEAVATAIARWTSGELETALDRAGVPWGRLNCTADVVRHPQLEADQRWRPVRLPSGDTVSVLKPPFRFSGAQRQDSPCVPALGEHTTEVLDE